MLYKKLYEYQRGVVDFALEVKTAAIFAKQRTGKTWISMAVIEQLMGPNYESLIVVPLNNIETTWQKSLTNELPELIVCRSWDDYKKATPPKALLMHYEGLPGIIKALLRRKTWSHIIFDESQRLKARGTRQSRIAKRLQYKAEHKLILSGTPIEKQPQDVWAQFRFLNPDVFGDRWEDFDLEYLKPTGYMGYQRKFRESKIEKFLALIKPYSIRIDKSVLKMPERQIQEIRVPMLGDQERHYYEMEDNKVTWYKDKRVMADMTLTQYVRLQQICGGFLSVENKEDEDTPPDIYEIGSAKLRRVKAIAKRTKPPFVIFCKYVPELFIVHDAMIDLFDRVELYYGKTPKRERAGIQEQFQKGLIDVLICQNRTGGLGIDLYRTSTAIIYSLTFSYIDFDQLISRFDLYEKKETVKIIMVMAKNSIDEDIYHIILNKENVSEKTLRKLRRQRRSTMAKKKVVKKKAAEKKAAEKKTAGAPKATEEFKFTVANLAEDLGIKEASVRVKLRNAEVEKAGRAYGWNKKTDYDKVLKQLKG